VFEEGGRIEDGFVSHIGTWFSSASDVFDLLSLELFRL